MKRLLSGFIVGLLFFNILFPLNVIAMDKNAIKYGANESFVILIPSGFTFDNDEYKTSIVAKNVLISNGKTLNISLSSDNYNNKWRAKDLVTGKEYVAYKIGIDDKYSVENGDIVLAVNSGEKYNDEVSQDLYFKLIEKTVSGYYHDVLTFITEVV